MDNKFFYKITKKGYLEIKHIDWNCWKLEHRYLVEKYIGRKLKKGEVVYHRNGDKKDSRINNLQLFPDMKTYIEFENALKKKRGKQIKMPCIRCGKERILCKTEIQRNNFNFCSQVCYAKFTVGRNRCPRSDETKDKISKKNAGKGNGMWNGGKRHSGGYIKIHCPNHPNADSAGYMGEHRLVVEKKIGRYLTKKEQVHHIDFSRSNNQIVNLMLFPSGREHAIWHNRIKRFPYLTNPMKLQIKDRWRDLKKNV